MSMLKFRAHLWLIYGAITLMTIQSALLFAQDFYEKDFARVPGRDLPTAGIPQPPIDQTTLESRAGATPTPATTISFEERVKALTRSVAEKAPTEGAGLNIPTPLPGTQQNMEVALVGAVLQSSDRESLLKQLEDMLRVLEPQKILIATIYCVGAPIEIPIKIGHQIGKRRGRILFVDQLPEKYARIKSSPTWILTSLDQEIILESAGLLSQNLNQEGKIVTALTKRALNPTENPVVASKGP